jgi:hypothetical protein
VGKGLAGPVGPALSVPARGRSHWTTTEDLIGEDLGSFVLVGARRKGGSTLHVAAMGRREVVLKECAGEQETSFENGVHFYRPRPAPRPLHLGARRSPPSLPY